jgi:putative DNA methylase
LEKGFWCVIWWFGSSFCDSVEVQCEFSLEVFAFYYVLFWGACLGVPYGCEGLFGHVISRKCERVIVLSVGCLLIKNCLFAVQGRCHRMVKEEKRELLISKWFPITEVSVESVRERSASSALPPLYFLHVWFARRPLVTARAAVLGSLLPDNVERDKTLKLLGIPIGVDLRKAQEEAARAKSSGKRLEHNPFFWKRSFEYTPSKNELADLHSLLEKSWGVKQPLIVDPMAGGGSIPYEAMRLGLPVVAGDLNPVAFVCLKGTLEYSAKFGKSLLQAVENFCNSVHEAAVVELEAFFPHEPNETVYRYLWARTIRCSSCGLVIPLSPNWWVVKDREDAKSIALRVVVNREEGKCNFELVKKPKKSGLHPDKGTVKGGRAECPGCNTVIDGDEIKREAMIGKMGHQLYVVSVKKKILGKNKTEWVFRTPTKKEIEALETAEEKLKERLADWEAREWVPNEEYIKGFSDRCSVYGVKKWRDLFNNRQLLTHLTYLEKFKQAEKKLFEGKQYGSEEWDFATAIIVYGSMVFDSCVDYNSLLGRWRPTRQQIAGAMAIQAFPFKWSYVESGHPATLWKWALAKVLDSLEEIIELIPNNSSKSKIYCGSSTKIPINSKSVPCIVVDPPYAENVMYAEVSDFFYVWLKRLLGDAFPENFKTTLTEKDEEAISNPARFKGVGGSAKKLAQEDYKIKLEACFKDMNRVLQDNGVMTVMFTHRTAEAWSSLATALMNANFTFVSSWPVHTEPPEKFAKTGKGVLKITVLLTCRKRKSNHPGIWEHIADELRDVAKQKIEEFSKLGINGPDLKVSVYAPVLGRFADYYPVRTATGKEIDPQQALDLVADVLNEKFLQEAGIQNADKETAAYINLLATFPTAETEYEEARLATVFGGLVTLDTLDTKSAYGLVEKKGKNIQILSARHRQAKGIINPYDTKTLKTTIDHIHAAILQYERGGLIQVKRLMQEKNLDTAGSPFPTVLQAYTRYADNSSNDNFQKDAAIAKALLTALGKSIEFAPKKGERLDHYTSES